MRTKVDCRAYFKSSDANTANGIAYAEGRYQQNDNPNRQPYVLGVENAKEANNCGTFAGCPISRGFIARRGTTITGSHPPSFLNPQLHLLGTIYHSAIRKFSKNCPHFRAHPENVRNRRFC
jgi:hypothetical protein